MSFLFFSVLCRSRVARRQDGTEAVRCATYSYLVYGWRPRRRAGGGQRRQENRGGRKQEGDGGQGSKVPDPLVGRACQCYLSSHKRTASCCGRLESFCCCCCCAPLFACPFLSFSVLLWFYVIVLIVFLSYVSFCLPHHLRGNTPRFPFSGLVCFTLLFSIFLSFNPPCART